MKSQSQRLGTSSWPSYKPPDSTQPHRTMKTNTKIWNIKVRLHLVKSKESIPSYFWQQQLFWPICSMNNAVPFSYQQHGLPHGVGAYLQVLSSSTYNQEPEFSVSCSMLGLENTRKLAPGPRCTGVSKIRGYLCHSCNTLCLASFE